MTCAAQGNEVQTGQTGGVWIAFATSAVLYRDDPVSLRTAALALS